MLKSLYLSLFKIKILIIFLLLQVNNLFAKEDPSQLWPGMTYGEVLQLCGAPIEKVVLEAKHQDIWFYSEIQVRFYQGKLTKVNPRKLPGVLVKSDIDEKKKVSKEQKVNNEQVTVVEDILTEMMKSQGTSPTPVQPVDPKDRMMQLRRGRR